MYELPGAKRIVPVEYTTFCAIVSLMTSVSGRISKFVASQGWRKLCDSRTKESSCDVLELGDGRKFLVAAWGAVVPRPPTPLVGCWRSLGRSRRAILAVALRARPSAPDTTSYLVGRPGATGAFPASDVECGHAFTSTSPSSFPADQERLSVRCPPSSVAEVCSMVPESPSSDL